MSKNIMPNFSLDEFRCKCCSSLPADHFPYYGMDFSLLLELQKIRDHYGQPVKIFSGYRCPIHNERVGGATHSQHLLGRAADIRVRGVSPAEVFDFLDGTHRGGLGRYEDFTHIDTRSYRARW